MTGVARLDVPLVVDVGVGANWDKATRCDGARV
jgi:DNA polymerase I-like protein with 3'-5' exonuclease and polymerase domains